MTGAGTTEAGREPGLGLRAGTVRLLLLGAIAAVMSGCMIHPWTRRAPAPIPPLGRAPSAAPVAQPTFRVVIARRTAAPKPRPLLGAPEESFFRGSREIIASPLAGALPAESDFARAVRKLQSLGYLPLVHASLHRRGSPARVRHDIFAWPVPAPLQRASDRYAWNAENPFIRAAVIRFERENGMLGSHGLSEGRLRKAVLARLFSTGAVAHAGGFEWVYVAKTPPRSERLFIWRRGTSDPGRWIWSAAVNTGVLGSTPSGTWPIYQRLPSTTMRGVFPIPISLQAYVALKGKRVPEWTGSALTRPARGVVNGHRVRWQPYNDPGIKWVNYFDEGRGIHYYPRHAYGFPQSAGCVEMSLADAAKAYRLLHDGALVTVSRRRLRRHEGACDARHGCTLSSRRPSSIGPHP